MTVCCLVLAMPQGWCGHLPALRGKVTGEAPKKLHGGCCDLCHCEDSEKPPPEPEAPAPPSRCCCYELDWLKPNPRVAVEADAALVGFVERVVGTLPHVSAPLEQGLTIHAPAPPIHLLKCVWLC